MTAGGTSGGPWAWHGHLAAWIAVVALAAAWATAVAAARRRGVPVRVTRHQRQAAAGALVALVVATTWPLADLAAHWSLTALVVQRLLLTLAAAPLLLLATPAPVLAWLTRPWPLDACLERLTHPVVAVAVVTAVAVGTLSGPAVHAQAVSTGTRAAIDAALLGAGMVLWAPVVRHVPGATRARPVGTAAYLFVQSVVPTFPAVVYVFARHPLYPAFAQAHLAIGLSPLGDQQLAGIVAKVGTLPVLWSAAWVALARAERADATGDDGELLLWADVERRLQRAERRSRRRVRLRPDRSLRPREPRRTFFPTVEPPAATPADDATAPGEGGGGGGAPARDPGAGPLQGQSTPPGGRRPPGRTGNGQAGDEPGP